MQKATRKVVVSASLATLITEAITAASPPSLFADWIQIKIQQWCPTCCQGGPVLPRLLSSTGLVLLSFILRFFFFFVSNQTWRQMSQLQASHEMTRLPAEVMINLHRCPVASSQITAQRHAAVSQSHSYLVSNQAKKCSTKWVLCVNYERNPASL